MKKSFFILLTMLQVHLVESGANLFSAQVLNAGDLFAEHVGTIYELVKEYKATVPFAACVVLALIIWRKCDYLARRQAWVQIHATSWEEKEYLMKLNEILLAKVASD